MDKLKRLFKKYLILFITFFIINIFFVWIVINISNIEEQLRIQQSLISSEAKTMYFYGLENVNKKEVLDMLEEKEFILEGIIIPATSEEEVEIKGIYYNYDIDKKYPLLEGRMFTVEELREKQKVALVGYNLKDKIINKIIKIKNEEYKVIGILGDEKSEALRNDIYVNLNSQDFSLNMKAITMDIAQENSSDIAQKISKKFKEEKNVEVIISEPIGKVDPLKDAIGENRTHLMLAFLASISLVSTVINIANNWIYKEKSIIGIKSLVGGTKKIIAFKFWLEYLVTIVLSLTMSFIVWILYHYINDLNTILNFKSFTILIFINILVSTLAFIVPMINLNRLNINSIIKENI